jgi:cellulose synthase/poly-beta-1,6-N-acetylglucosamine synthase-like glycosyltransferase
MDTPLVSILIPNYNYGRYLHTCLESALNQTYENLQVIFVDNNSTDDSYDIAMDFRSRYQDRLRVHRNAENMGGGMNARIARSKMDPRTRCTIYLSSDDFYHLTLVERCMTIMREHPSVGFVLCHRNAIDENDQITPEIPFYNRSCVIPSTSQMEVFMMAGIGVSTQCFRNLHVENFSNVAGWFFDIAGDWFSNFCLACESDMGYIMDPLCTYRTHVANVTSGAIKNLTNSLEHVRLIQAFSEIALQLDRQTVAQRLVPALEKLGKMCLRYCVQLLHEDDPHTAKRYLHLAPVLQLDIRDDPAWQTLWRLTRLDPEQRRRGLLEFEASNPPTRIVAYDPPADAVQI